MLYKLLHGQARELYVSFPFTLPLISSYHERVSHMTPGMGSIPKYNISVIATQHMAVVLKFVPETESPGGYAKTQIGAQDWALLTSSQILLMLLSRGPHA